MLSWINANSRSNAANRSTRTAIHESSSNLETMCREVKSLEDCEALLSTEGLLSSSGLLPQHLATISKLVEGMRAKGLGLEPNLMGRAAARLFALDSLKGSASLVLSAADSDFNELVRGADSERDAARFDAAQYLYWRSLDLFPFHPGVLTQYGHCLKERNLFADAVVAYIDALIAAAPLRDIQAHLIHASSRIGEQAGAERLIAQISIDGGTQGDPLSRRLSSKEIVALAQLFIAKEPSVLERAKWMFHCGSARALIGVLISRDDFKANNKDLLRFVSETQLAVSK